MSSPLSQAATVSIVGAGPGDPELLTLRALRRIEAAEVILYDRLVSAEILAFANPNAEFIYCGKDEGHQQAVQNEIFQLLINRAQRGLNVVRLKGGDPFIFGRGAEEAEVLAQTGIASEVVPGVTSALSAPTLAGIPVTYRGQARSVAIVTGRCQGGELEDWRKVALVDTLVILMGVKHRAKIAAQLIACGRPHDQPIAFIENASTTEERITISTLAQAAEANVAAPAVWVCGEVVSKRHELQAMLAQEAYA